MRSKIGFAVITIARDMIIERWFLRNNARNCDVELAPDLNGRLISVTQRSLQTLIKVRSKGIEPPPHGLLPTSSLDAALLRSWSGLCLCHALSRLGRPRKVSTRSSFEASLGVGSTLLSGRSPNLRSFHFTISSKGSH